MITRLHWYGGMDTYNAPIKGTLRTQELQHDSKSLDVVIGGYFLCRFNSDATEEDIELAMNLCRARYKLQEVDDD